MDYVELLDYLKTQDEVTLLELLDVSADELVEAFADKIKDNINKIYRFVDE